MNRKLPDKFEHTLIEVQVVPDENQIKSGRWSRFIAFLKKLRDTPEGRASEALAKDYLKQSCIDAFETKKRTRIQNTKMAAEIDEIRGHIRGGQDANTRSNLIFEQEYEAKKAEVRFKNAEANDLETETTLKVMNALKERGFDVSLSYQKGRLEIFLVDSAATAATDGPDVLNSSEVDALLAGIAPTDSPIDAREVATKIDLATAYEEMGDRDGARELWKDVAREGSPQQQEVAQQRIAVLR